MKKTIIQLFSLVLLDTVVNAQTITNDEYFFDTDPGTGNGSPITISSPGDSVDVNTSIPINSLSVGFHNLNIRTKNSNGVWSLYDSRSFFIQPTITPSISAKIDSAEYFFDADPGVGNGTPIAGITSADSVNVNVAATTTSLQPGFHNFFVRVKNTDGIWSLYEGRNLYIQPVVITPSTPQLNAAEYFFDTDPGVGNGTPVTGITTADSININAAASIASLSQGFHALFVRVKNNDNIWSLYEGRRFYISPIVTAKKSSKIVAAEYFFDTDPGVGNGMPISGITPADSINIVKSLDASMLSLGAHKAFIRVKDSSGVWSLYQGGNIMVKNCTISAITSKTDVTCNGTNSGTASITPFGGSGAYTYSWSTNPIKTTSSVSGLAAGNYIVSVADTSGCAATDSITITEPPVYVLTTSKTNTKCGANNGVANVAASGNTPPYTYAWSTSPISTAPTATGLAPGAYTITVTDKNGCTKTDAVGISPSVNISLSINSTNSTCHTADGSATVTASAGATPYTYKWSSGDTLPAASNLASGIYIATVTDAIGCSNFTIATISDVGSATITPLVTKVSLSCNVPNGAIDISITGAASPYTYLWSNGATTQDVTGLQEGPYEVYVTDKDGCVSNKSIPVQTSPLITYNILSNNANCGSSDGSAGVVAAGGNTPYTYSWDNGVTASTTTGLAPGNYDVMITDASGCTASGVASISSIGAATIAVTALSQADCYNGTGGSISLTVTGGVTPYTYSWSNGATTKNLSNVMQGIYDLKVTGGNNCVSAYSGMITSVAPTTPGICMVTVDSLNHNSIIWDKISGKKVKGYNIYKETTQSGIYQKIAFVPYNNLSWYVDLVSDANKRSYRYKISIVDSCDNESAKSSEHKTMHLTVNNGPNNKYNLIWDNYEGFPFYSYIVKKGYHPFNLFTIDTVPNNLFTFTDTSTVLPIYYAMDVVSPSTCFPTAKTYFESRSNTTKTSAVGIADKGEREIALSLYPNPNNGMFNLQLRLEEKQQLTIRMYNSSAQLLFTETKVGFSGAFTKTFQMAAYPQGLYYVQILTEKGVYLKKVVIE